MTSANITAKADRYLTEGRVSIDVANPTFVYATVAGSGGKPYSTRYGPATGWFCTCPAQVNPCAHIVAVQKITRIEPLREVLFTGDSDLDRMMYGALHGGTADE